MSSQGDYKNRRAPKMPTCLKVLIGFAVIIAMIDSCADVEASPKSDAECLARLGYAEARGESVEGVVAVMGASVNHSRQAKVGLCHLPAKYKPVPARLHPAYLSIAQLSISGSIEDASHGANAWRSKGGKAKGGRVVAHIGHHRFSKVIHLASK